MITAPTDCTALPNNKEFRKFLIGSNERISLYSQIQPENLDFFEKLIALKSYELGKQTSLYCIQTYWDSILRNFSIILQEVIEKNTFPQFFILENSSRLKKDEVAITNVGMEKTPTLKIRLSKDTSL